MPGKPVADVSRIARVLRLHTDSRPESLREARREVRHAVAQAGLGLRAAQDLEVAAGEVLTNTHDHAYAAGTGPVFVEVFHTSRMVGVVIIDIGAADTPTVVPSTPPPSTDHRGRGLYMVGRLADEVNIRVSAIGHGLAVLVVKRFASGPVLAS